LPIAVSDLKSVALTPVETDEQDAMPTRRNRHCVPRLTPLEPRELLTITGFTASSKPHYLVPPNGRYVPITVVGTVDVREQNVSPSVNFQVVDEYRKNQPRANVRTQLISTSPRRFQFAFTVRLPASVASADVSGRQFYIIVAARDPNGSAGKALSVVVPNP
jgi:hypothetical protein